MSENSVALENKPRDLSNRPDTYNTTGVQGASKEYKSDLSKVPGRILERKMVPVFHLEVNLVEELFEMVHYVEKGKKPQWGYFPKAGNPQLVTKFDVLKDVALEKDSIVKESPNLQKTIHQVCLAHVKAKFDKASGLAGDRSADIFLQLIAFFYRRERQYDDEGLTPEERGESSSGS